MPETTEGTTDLRTRQQSPSLPSPEEMKERYEAAAREGVCPTLWIPPEWNELKGGFPNTCTYDKFFANGDEETRIERMREDGRLKDVNPVKSPESPPDAESWPHPFADTSHVDETEFSHEDHEELEGKLGEDSPLLKKLHGILGDESPGMKRLSGIFQWILYRATELMGELNEGLKKEEDYEAARHNYIEFLKDLDDHEPEKGTKKSPRDIAKRIAASKAAKIENCRCDDIAKELVADIEQCLTDRFRMPRANKRAAALAAELGELFENKSIPEINRLSTCLDPTNWLCAGGYGRAIKWICIDPVICDSKIVGARIVAKWNPHECSSGIPIPHK